MVQPAYHMRISDLHGALIGTVVSVSVFALFYPSRCGDADSLAAIVPSVEAVATQTVRLVVVGDVMLARAVERMMESHGAAYPYSFVQSSFAEADAVVANFEAAIPEVHVPTPSLTMQFSVSSAYLPALAASGISHVSLANNHADDYGNAGYRHTTNALTAAGLVPFGKPYELATSSIAYIRTDGADVALVGVYAVDVVPDEALISHAFNEASQHSDIQIAYVHWGNEYELVHHATQEQLAHAFVDAGADLVIGHHPHVIQDVAMYRGKPVFYSLGNFIFDQYFNADVLQGLMLELTITDDRIEVVLVPVSTASSRTAPQILAGEERQKALEMLAERSEPSVQEAISAGTMTVALE